MPSGTGASDLFCVGEDSTLASAGSSSSSYPSNVNSLLLLVMGRGIDRLWKFLTVSVTHCPVTC